VGGWRGGAWERSLWVVVDVCRCGWISATDPPTPPSPTDLYLNPSFPRANPPYTPHSITPTQPPPPPQQHAHRRAARGRGPWRRSRRTRGTSSTPSWSSPSKKTPTAAAAAKEDTAPTGRVWMVWMGCACVAPTLHVVSLPFPFLSLFPSRPLCMCCVRRKGRVRPLLCDEAWVGWGEMLGGR
jgi:hypothetical protein